jgi:hypothetical protein
MKIISVYFTNLILVFLLGCSVSAGQDTVIVPLKIRVAAEISGPVLQFFDKDIRTYEGNLLVDLTERRTAMIGGGYANYSYSQYNYDYKASGMFLKAGMDFNLMGPAKSRGRFFTGIGLHYGLSRYNSEVPSFRTENYWGVTESSVGSRKGMAHFFEATPSVRTEIFRNVSMGWNINIRFLLNSGTDDNLRMLYLPGFGDAGKKVSTGLSYFITYNIPYRRKTVIILPPPPEEPEDDVLIIPEQ